MWDFIKGVLGIPKNEKVPRSLDEPVNRFKNPIWDTDGLSDDDSVDNEWQAPRHPFVVFTNPLEMHTYFEQQMDELMKKAFQFSGFPQITLDVGDANGTQNDSTGNLRDEFLKPGLSVNTGEDGDLDGRIDSHDIQNFLETPSQPLKRHQQKPTFFSRSVTVRSVRRPDGTVETVRTEKDNTGREETTITTHEGTGPQPSQILPSPMGPNLSGEDLISKLFSF